MRGSGRLQEDERGSFEGQRAESIWMAREEKGVPSTGKNAPRESGRHAKGPLTGRSSRSGSLWRPNVWGMSRRGIRSWRGAKRREIKPLRGRLHALVGRTHSSKQL